MDQPPLPPHIAYDHWAPSYGDTGRNVVTAAAAGALREVLPLLGERDVLDIGCGDGRWCVYAARARAASVTGIDRSHGMLRAARRRPPPGGTAVGYAQADLRALPFAERTFDVVLHALALGHVARPGPAIGAAARVLRQGGQLALVDLHPDAAARGWRRTFQTPDGTTREVTWHPHALAEVRRACAASGLQVAQLVEQPLDPAALPADAPPAARGGHAVYALRAVLGPAGRA